MKVIANFDKTVGKIKPMHGVGQPPFSGVSFSMFHYLTEAGIPYSRLHDVGGAYGGFRWVDIPNIFRDFEKDPTDPKSYDFAFTDLLITALVESGVEPFFRLGVSIENASKIKAYRIDPPTDSYKWAVICEHIIRHYTEGWADGFFYSIKYWEIWNEPDNYEDIYENHMWRGTKEQYYELYNVASKHLKKCFPHLKIGGYASCGFYALEDTFIARANSSPRREYFLEFFDGFLKFIRENNCPLDFFSWHSYDAIERNKLYASYARRRLDEAGYTETETICNEWNCEPDLRGTAKHAALTCGMMLALQDTALDSAMFYDAQLGVSVYGSMFNPLTREPFPAYYAFKAFNELYKLGEQIDVSIDEKNLYVLGAKKDGHGCIVIANPTEDDIPLALSQKWRITECLLTSYGKNEEKTELPSLLPQNSFLVIKVSSD